MLTLIDAPTSAARLSHPGLSNQGLSTPKSTHIARNNLPSRGPDELVSLAERGLSAAIGLSSDGLRYAAAHLAALRAAAAILSTRARPGVKRRGRPRSVWVLLAAVAPEMGEWAAFFSASAVKRAAAEAGIPDVVSTREADDLVRETKNFLDLVRMTLGVPESFIGPTYA